MSTWRAFVVLGICLSVAGCGPQSRGRGDEPDLAGGGGGNLDGGTTPSDGPIDNDAFWAQDPPPMFCALDGGAFPPPKNPGGTPACPDDKNREGCACPTLGKTAACWPGLRANRSLGSCMDGTTTCVSMGELGQAWGPCMGYVLPTPDATGKDACRCFSAGKWALDNLSPCFYDSGTGPGSGGAASTVIVNKVPQCVPMMGMLTKPNMPWSPDTVTADCAGHFKLCYTLKAGDGKNPLPNDCVVATACTEGDYVQVNMPQSFPDLPAWVAGDPAGIACAKKFAQTGGYGEMSVDGETIMCDQVKKVFNRVVYCPLACNANPNLPGCMNCNAGGGGGF